VDKCNNHSKLLSSGMKE